MGFPATTTYKLVFDDPALDGLVVKVKSVSIRARDEYNKLETDEAIVDWFPQVLVEWNLEDDGGPVPLTADGIRSIDFDVFNAIIDAWRNAKRVRPPAPLEQPSNDGDATLEASMPMATLPPSLAS